MRFMRSWISIFLLSGLFLVTMPAIAQTRTNTKELSKELQKVADQKRQEAAKLRTKADAAQAAVDAAKKKFAENEGTIVELDRERQQIRDEKAKLLGELVWELMNNEEIGALLRAKPERIRMIPGIQDLLKKVTWLDPVLDEILKDYM